MSDLHPQPSRPSPRKVRSRGKVSTPWDWLTMLLVTYILAGLLLSAFSPPYWVWPIALLGTLLQALALSGREGLNQLLRSQVGWNVLIGILGSGALGVALAIATNFAGPDDIDKIELGSTAVTVLLINLGVLCLTVVCTIVSAKTGDRLLGRFNRLQSSSILASVCFLGLVFGGLVGLAGQAP